MIHIISLVFFLANACILLVSDIYFVVMYMKIIWRIKKSPKIDLWWPTGPLAYWRGHRPANVFELHCLMLWILCLNFFFPFYFNTASLKLSHFLTFWNSFKRPMSTCSPSKQFFPCCYSSSISAAPCYFHLAFCYFRFGPFRPLSL